MQIFKNIYSILKLDEQELDLERNISEKKKRDILKINRNRSGINILIIEDDFFLSRDYAQALSSLGEVNVYTTGDVVKAFGTIMEYRDILGYVVLDIRLPFEYSKKNRDNDEFIEDESSILNVFNEFDTVGGYKTGCILLTEIINFAPDIQIIGLTNSQDALDFAMFELHNFEYIEKNKTSPQEFANRFKSKYMKEKLKIQSFIVHGHDTVAMLELKNYLQNVLGLPEPIILSEQKTGGRTIIEKFEHYSNKADLVFSLLTPDDYVNSSNQQIKQARPNVLFELGYFMGVLGRKSGKIIVLHKSDTSIPTDLNGLLYIDISQGIEQAGEKIRREIEDQLF